MTQTTTEILYRFKIRRNHANNNQTMRCVATDPKTGTNIYFQQSLMQSSPIEVPTLILHFNNFEMEHNNKYFYSVQEHKGQGGKNLKEFLKNFRTISFPDIDGKETNSNLSVADYTFIDLVEKERLDEIKEDKITQARSIIKNMKEGDEEALKQMRKLEWAAGLNPTNKTARTCYIELCELANTQPDKILTMPSNESDIMRILIEKSKILFRQGTTDTFITKNPQGELYFTDFTGQTFQNENRITEMFVSNPDRYEAFKKQIEEADNLEFNWASVKATTLQEIPKLSKADERADAREAQKSETTVRISPNDVTNLLKNQMWDEGKQEWKPEPTNHLAAKKVKAEILAIKAQLFSQGFTDVHWDKAGEDLCAKSGWKWFTWKK